MSPSTDTWIILTPFEKLRIAALGVQGGGIFTLTVSLGAYANTVTYNLGNSGQRCQTSTGNAMVWGLVGWFFLFLVGWLVGFVGGGVVGLGFCLI